ncbi:MAG: tRNA (adenosine(37)-N6)-dimethylallyltransferase MiaA [Patescibacteria group bacterium]|nr:tRNA (adenosine(37)-N6)-dimethylallyltransferase MiaA [Patescibacteria group bacterium]
MSISNRKKIIIILGPTASGKSDLAVKIAEYIEMLAKFKKVSETQNLKPKTYLGGEIISADSRQIYRGLDIGSGKVPILYKPQSDASIKSSIPPKGRICMYYRGIEHYLLDVASPKKIFTVSQYQKLAKKALKEIIAKNKIPIICGGAGLYIDSLIYEYIFPEVPPQKEIRKKLEKLATKELFKKLQKLDPQRAEVIDKNNRRRIIRSLEIVIATGKSIPKIELFPSTIINNSSPKKYDDYNILKIGIRKSPEELKKLIRKRLEKRMKIGMVEEVESLHKNGLSWKRLDDLGLEYRFISRYLRGLISKKEMENSIISESLKYAKRQMTWFKRDKSTKWIGNKKEAIRLVSQFLQQ